MKWTTWTLFLLTLALVAGGVAMVRRQARTTPQEFFDTVASRIASGRYDREQAVQNLDHVLERAQTIGDSDLAARVLLLRGRTLRDLGAYDRAKADLLAAASLRPTDPAVEDDLVELEARAGDYHAALARAARIVERDPAAAHGHVLLGRLHRQAADKALSRGHALLERALVPETARTAVALVSRSAALDPADERRIAIAHRLRGLLRMSDEARLEELLDIADAASKDLEAARAAWSASLSRGVEPEAVAGLVDLFERAGRTELAVDLGTVTVPTMRTDEEFARTLLQALAQLGRWRYAGELAAIWGTRATPVAPEFLLECCEALWRSQRMITLVHTANTVLSTSSSTERSTAELYIGLQVTEYAPRIDDPAAARREWQHGRQRLSLFTSTATRDPFPGARAEAWRRIAVASRALGEPLAERTALNGYLQLAPDADGEAWLRLAEIELASPNAGYREPALHYARGMSLLPRRSAELMPGWHDIGTREMRAVGVDLESARRSLLAGKGWTPSGDPSPYERFRLAEMHADVGDFVHAATHVRRLLDIVPGFVPGLDLSIRIADGQKKPDERMDALLERVRRAGRNQTIDAILRETPLDAMEPRALFRLMRADPERSGRLALAGGMARRGETAAALSTLSAVGEGEPGPEGRLLAARLHLSAREPQRALDVLAPLGQDILPLKDGIEVYLRAALGAGDRTRTESTAILIARRIATANDARRAGAQSDAPPPPPAEDAWNVDRKRALRIVDLMLTSGDGASPLPILLALDGSAQTRGGDVLLRIAQSAALRGQGAAAREALVRAQAFETGGGADYESMVLSALDEPGTASDGVVDFGRMAERVAAADYAMGPLGRIQNRIVQGRAAEVRAVLVTQLDGPQKRDPWWQLTAAAAGLMAGRATVTDMPAWLGKDAASEARILLAGPDGTRDPRRMLVLLGAARDTLGAPLARAWLDRASTQDLGDLWPDWIRASMDASAGHDRRALETLERLLARHPDFGPAWDLKEEILERGELDETARSAFRRERDAHVGEAGTHAERLLDAASTQRDAGAIEAALQSARTALAEDPWLADARLLVAELQMRTGNDRAALATLQEALGQEPPDDGRAWPMPRAEKSESRIVRAYLDVIARLREAGDGVLPRERIETLLRGLATQRPDDPRVVLAQAELDLDADARSPYLGVMRAYNRLDTFRTAHKGVPLETLGEGSLEAWARFHIRLDPVRAQAFLADEMELDPTVLAGWVESAYAAEASGDATGALRRMELCARLAPRGDVLRALLRMRAAGEITPEEIDARVQTIVAAEGRGGPDASLLLLQARCTLNLGPRYQGRALELLEGLDAWRDLSPRFRAQHAILTATVRLSRGTPEDVTAARAALEDVRGWGDPYERVYVEALRGLSRSL